MVGIIGPDGMGKSSPLGVIAGVRIIQRGEVIVLGDNLADDPHRISPIANRLTRKAFLSVAESI